MITDTALEGCLSLDQMFLLPPSTFLSLPAGDFVLARSQGTLKTLPGSTLGPKFGCV